MRVGRQTLHSACGRLLRKHSSAILMNDFVDCGDLFETTEKSESPLRMSTECASTSVGESNGFPQIEADAHTHLCL